MRPRFIWRAIPAIIGALLALWLLRGDTEAMPNPEGSMGRTEEMPRIVGMSGEEFISGIVSKEEESVSFQDVKVFEIRFTDGTAVTVMGSSSVPVIQYLGRYRTMALELRPRELQRIER